MLRGAMLFAIALVVLAVVLAVALAPVPLARADGRGGFLNSSPISANTALGSGDRRGCMLAQRLREPA